MRKWLFRLLILGGVAALAGRYALQAAEPVPVRVTEVGRARVEATITNSKAGTVRARRRAQLSAEVGGRVVEITHREGDRVEEGALLVRLNDASPRAQLTRRIFRRQTRNPKSHFEVSCWPLTPNAATHGAPLRPIVHCFSFIFQRNVKKFYIQP